MKQEVEEQKPKIHTSIFTIDWNVTMNVFLLFYLTESSRMMLHLQSVNEH